MLRWRCDNNTLFKRSIRTLKTNSSHIYSLKAAECQIEFLSHITKWDAILNSISNSKSLLYANKYDTKPRVFSSDDHTQLTFLIKRHLDSLLFSQDKLGRIGLNLFLDIFQDRLTTPLATTLLASLLGQIRLNFHFDTIQAVITGLEHVRIFLANNRVFIDSPKAIGEFIDNLGIDPESHEITSKVLKEIDYKLSTDDIVRAARGTHRYDVVDVSKGWKWTSGIPETDEKYLRSIFIKNNKFVSINGGALVLIYDGDLIETRGISPTLDYMNNEGRSLVLIVTGTCEKDALNMIAINNNKNKRKGKNVKTVLLKYNSVENGNLSIQENFDLLEFLSLPNGVGSIYSPKFSDNIPSSRCANQYYGTLESLKATIGEAFLYNSNGLSEVNTSSPCLKKRVTINVGGETMAGIDDRRNMYDNLFNNLLCHGLSEGFIPSYGISLVKSIPYLRRKVITSSLSMNERLGYDILLSALTSPMERALMGEFYYRKHEATAAIIKTMENTKFTDAYLTVTCARPQNVLRGAKMEPWNKVDDTLRNIINFIKVITSCGNVIAKTFEKPRRQ
ncbi:hypothetical protein KAFR_0C00600 [Kazachstania africana CBS 2517]|uniref:Uncharacterized protein n=1 Tax=Kazachstania africana (strain ATCC 22294 / BCRC 22015 / CBS 2517 / CECT 1963 / NBRC 1671 / NRRL Y-8276) TaxID=1071382 RepID=H2ARQ5_KAZAF|nr:hypothetical protein KAFR_0C00600 [Kazachstania africana CBS 2517]CCF57055.1 hypothetical protein KAFR_0C00600 [Kazachstania africana CBS 2517]